jgi:hypothetical protein
VRPIYFTVADSFFESSIMQEELPVRFVMFALIRLAQRSAAEGIVDVDLRTFAGSINIPPADVERAIKRLMRPDPASGSPDEQGRRIVPVNPERPMRGWRLVTFQKNRRMVHDANAASRMRRLREERSEGVPVLVPDVPPVPTRRDETKKRGTPLTPRSGGPSKKTPRLGEVRRFNASMVGASRTAYAKAYKQRFGVLPPASSR